MHKSIVECIKFVIENNVNNSSFREHCRVFVCQKDTAGFWSMIVEVDNKYDFWLENIRSVAVQIGKMYGEELCTEMRINPVDSVINDCYLKMW